ncbi:unnamed protein product [Didymodactylos carnosus]|uniref:Gamma-aminobutyric acid receptor subunit beta n=1 Tax=Didymodactylos carnosus TaxID=1234261 RepID=A0A8S2DJV7_9BILA|nr:unnamed protein product [Didymodactylos carnosus]CAF3756441.1 unnamed protein product [Didymodactylos carnosus]
MTTVRLRDVSTTIEELLKSYDSRLRPSFGNTPLLLDIEIRLASFDSISEVNMDYTLTLYLNQYWRDDRLAYGDISEEIILTGEIIDRIWLPDTFFPNDKSAYLHDVTEKNKMIRLNGNGDIVYGMRFTTTLACMMDLRRYPLDRQNCTVEVESYGYTQADVIMQWKHGKQSVLDLDKVQLPQFTIMDYNTISYGMDLATGVYQRLSLSFILQRNIGYFLFQTYLPSILIVMLSWDEYEIEEESSGRRSPILSLRNRTQLNHLTENCVTECTNANYEQTNHPPRLNTIIRGSTLYGKTFLSSPSSRTKSTQKRSRADRFLNAVRLKANSVSKSLPHIKDVNDIDKWCRLLFPVLFVIFNIFYWWYYMSRASHHAT